VVKAVSDPTPARFAKVRPEMTAAEAVMVTGAPPKTQREPDGTQECVCPIFALVVCVRDGAVVADHATGPSASTSRAAPPP
jgi:hypothetical protein